MHEIIHAELGWVVCLNQGESGIAMYLGKDLTWRAYAVGNGYSAYCQTIDEAVDRARKAGIVWCRLCTDERFKWSSICERAKVFGLPDPSTLL